MATGLPWGGIRCPRIVADQLPVGSLRLVRLVKLRQRRPGYTARSEDQDRLVGVDEQPGSAVTTPEESQIAVAQPGPVGRRLRTGLLLTIGITVLGLVWAKWWPYSRRVVTLAGSRTWTGSDLLQAGGVRPGDPPSWHAAISFAVAYLGSIWQALVVALLVAAAVQTLLPRQLLVRLLSSGGAVRQTATAAALGTPSMMCTCCTAPVARSLRLSGVPATATAAFWLANPMLNPAVLVFFCLTLPWEWTLTRFAVGAALVFGAALVIARFGNPGSVMPADQPGGSRAAVAYPRTLVRSIAILVPEYIATVLLIGAFRGWLFPIDAARATGIAAVVVAAVVGTMMVIPTGGEIAIVPALAAAGLATGPAGALLVTLPAVSVPGVAMVGRSLGWRATGLVAASAVAAGCLAGALLAALP